MTQDTKLGPGGYPVAAPASGPRVLTLAAGPGVYTITGDSAALLATHILNASPGSYTITGASAQLLHSYHANASPGSYTVTGASAGLIRTHLLNASPGSYTITGASARLLEGHVLTAAPGAYVITGAPANLFVPGKIVLAALPGSYSITGASATLLKGTSRDIDAVLTPKQLHELRRRLARERAQRGRNLEKEGQTRAELRQTLESFFKVAEPEQVEEIKEKLPILAHENNVRTEIGEFRAHIDWPKLYDDRALMEGLTRDLSKILAGHLERQRRFEQEEDDLAILMMA